MRRLSNLDSGESIFFIRELEQIKTRSYDIRYAELKGRSLIPVSNEISPGAETVVYEQYDQVGMAKVIASYADDLPRADVKGKEFTARIRSLGDSYGYTVQEIRAAKYAQKPLEQRRANAAKRAILQKENLICFNGDSAYGLLGFINHPNISSITVDNDGTGSSTLWSTKTPDQIIRDLNKLANYIVENTLMVEQPDTLLLPVAKFNYINSTARSANSDTTILKYFLNNNEYIKSVEPVNELKAAGAGGLDRMMAYKKDPEKLEQEIPQDFEQFDPQPRNLEFVVPCHSRYGGVQIYYPLSVAYGDGI